MLRLIFAAGILGVAGAAIQEECARPVPMPPPPPCEDYDIECIQPCFDDYISDMKDAETVYCDEMSACESAYNWCLPFFGEEWCGGIRDKCEAEADQGWYDAYNAATNSFLDCFEPCCIEMPAARLVAWKAGARFNYSDNKAEQ